MQGWRGGRGAARGGGGGEEEAEQSVEQKREQKRQGAVTQHTEGLQVRPENRQMTPDGEACSCENRAYKFKEQK